MTDPNIKSEIVNIGPDEDIITINELYEKISNKLKFNRGAVSQEARPNEVKFANCSSDKARNILKYKTSVNLDQSLDKLIKFIKKEAQNLLNIIINLKLLMRKPLKLGQKKYFNLLEISISGAL